MKKTLLLVTVFISLALSCKKSEVQKTSMSVEQLQQKRKEIAQFVERIVDSTKITIRQGATSAYIQKIQSTGSETSHIITYNNKPVKDYFLSFLVFKVLLSLHHH